MATTHVPLRVQMAISRHLRPATIASISLVTISAKLRSPQKSGTRPRLDYFVKDQSIVLDENIVSFDAIQHGSTAILITANKLNDVNSTVYKRDTNFSKFVASGQVSKLIKQQIDSCTRWVRKIFKVPVQRRCFATANLHCFPVIGNF